MLCLVTSVSSFTQEPTGNEEQVVLAPLRFLADIPGLCRLAEVLQCCESQLALTHRVPAPRGCMSLSPHLPAGLPGPQGRDVQPFLCQAETLGSDSSACVIISSAWPVNRDIVPENALRASGNVFGLHPWMEAAGQEIIKTKDVPDLGKGKERRPLSHFIHCQKLDFWMTPLFPQA